MSVDWNDLYFSTLKTTFKTIWILWHPTYLLCNMFHLHRECMRSLAGSSSWFMHCSLTEKSRSTKFASRTLCPGKENLTLKGEESVICRNRTSHLACFPFISHREKQLQLREGAGCIYCARWHFAPPGFCYWKIFIYLQPFIRSSLLCLQLSH